MAQVFGDDGGEGLEIDGLYEYGGAPGGEGSGAIE